MQHFQSEWAALDAAEAAALQTDRNAVFLTAAAPMAGLAVIAATALPGWLGAQATVVFQLALLWCGFSAAVGWMRVGQSWRLGRRVDAEVVDARAALLHRAAVACCGVSATTAAVAVSICVCLMM